MSTLRITNIEAKADPSSPTVDEKIKLTNSNGDILVHIDGKTSGITTIGINTTAGNIKFDQNSNVVVTGIITATKFVGTIEPTNLTVTGISTFSGDVTVNGDELFIADSIKHVGDTDTSISFPANDTITARTNGAERLRITSDGNIGIGNNNPGDFRAGAENLVVGSGSGAEGMTIYSATNASGRICFADGSGASDEERGVIQYAHDDNHMQFNTNATEALRITSDGRVLVGTTDAGSNGTADDLVVANNSSASDQAGISIRGGTSGRSQIFFSDGTSGQDEYRGMLRYDHSENSMQFRTNAVERLRIKSDGQVKVGGNTLATPNGNADNFVIDTGDVDSGLSILSATTGRIYFGDAADAAAGSIRYVHTDNSLRFEAAGGEKLRITSDGDLESGNVTISAFCNTHNVGNYSVFLSDNHANTFFGQNLRLDYSGTSGNHQLDVINQHAQVGGAGMLIGGNQSPYVNQLKFFTVPANQSAGTRVDNTAYARMTIGSDGKFYYGTTSQGPHGGFFNIDASSTNNANGINVKGTTANYVMVSSAGGSSGDHIYFSNYSNSNVNTGRIKDNQSNVTYYTSSDYRLKDNVVSITDGITRVKQLNPVRHTWINNPALGTVDGWIAHELDEVCPDAVDGEKDAVGEDGSIKAQAADYGRITPLLAAALKELIAKVETLEAAVTALQGS